MDADLVHAPGFGKTPQQGELHPVPQKSSFYYEFSRTLLASRIHHLPHPDLRRADLTGADDRCVAFPLVLRWPAFHDGEVLLTRLAAFEDHAQLPRGGGVFRDQHQPACLAVQPGDDPQARAVLQLVGIQIFQTAEQGWLGLVVRGMDDQRRGLVHDHPIAGLIDHAEIHDHLQAHLPLGLPHWF